MKYKNPRSLEQAIREIINNAIEGGSPYSHNELRMQFAHQRLLARIFNNPASKWVVKGNGALLLRQPGHARKTGDIDFMYNGKLEDSVSELKKIIGADNIEDFFKFELVSSKTSEFNLRGVEVVRMNSFLGLKEYEKIDVDISVDGRMTQSPSVKKLELGILVPGLNVPNGFVFPLVDHITDKHLAMLEVRPGNRLNTRYKDLIDLVEIALHNKVYARDLYKALHAGYHDRSYDPPSTIRLPSPEWENGYKRIFSENKMCKISDPHEAIDIVRKFLLPVIQGRKTGAWNPLTLEWEDE